MHHGRLYTNIIPNLLVRDIANTIRNAKASKVYIANIMTEAGETRNYKLSDHIRAIFEHSGGRVFDHCICDTGDIVPEFIRLYHKKGSEVVEIDSENVKEMGIKLLKKDLSKVENGKIIHDPDTIALTIMQIIFSNIKYSEDKNQTQYALLKDVMRKQKRVQKRKEKNLNKLRSKENGKYRESRKTNNRAGSSNIKAGKHSKNAEYVEKRSRLMNNLDKIYNRFDRKQLKEEKKESRFSEKYKSRIESVRNADKKREENLKNFKKDEEKLKQERLKEKERLENLKMLNELNTKETLELIKEKEENKEIDLANKMNKEKKTIKMATGSAKE